VPAPVSVIIPTFNRYPTVCDAIDSVKQQTTPPAEIIVVDDGSTDDTAVHIQQRYPDITLIQQTNNGVSHARNRGIEIATQAWIALLDSDDRWLPKKLATQMTALKSEPDTQLCHCDETWIRNGKRVNPMDKHKKRGGTIFEHCLPLCAISPSAAIIRTSLFQELGLFDETLPACEDYDLWLRITAKYPVLYVDEALLEKTGGHSDQLSRAHWGMDRFRLQALAGILRSGELTTEQEQLASATFMQKFSILHKGALKRDNTDFAHELSSRYADLLKRYT